MHQLISTKQAMADRWVTLKNIKTGIVDYCFDRSNFPEDEYPGFYFMKPGGVYDCKISLFGDVGIDNRFSVSNCHVRNANVMLGKCRLVEVDVDGNTYYIHYRAVRDVVAHGHFPFTWTRKDLIQVNDVIISDFFVFDFWVNE